MNENAEQITTVKNCKAGVSSRLARHQRKIESIYRTEFRLLSTCLKHDFRVSLSIDTAPQFPWKLNLFFFFSRLSVSRIKPSLHQSMYKVKNVGKR